MKVFSGSSNLPLAKKIASELKVSLAKIELSRFPNGEARVWIKEKKVGRSAVLVQSFSNPPDEYIMEFCLLVDALKRLGVKKITAVIPWLGYCVQDKVFRTGEPLSSKVIAKILDALNISKVVTLDLHNETIAGFFDMDFEHLKGFSLFSGYFKKKKGIDAVVSPDVGALKQSTRYAQELGLPLVIINKKRNLSTGKVSIAGVAGDIKGKRVLIADDFISTGGTLLQTAKFLKEKGVKKVYAALTHHFYVPGVQEKIEVSDLDMLLVTDSIKKPEKKFKKLKIVSAAKLLAEHI
jgi:ribose-phosphate pyrophosphokinase